MDIKQAIIIGAVVLTGCIVLGILSIKGNQAAFTALCSLVSAALSYVLGVNIGQRIMRKKLTKE